MTKQVQRRRGTATQHTSFTGAEGEISVNTTNKSVHVHDGTTAGGIEAARADMTNVTDADLNARLNGNTLSSLTITSADINGGTIDGTVIGGTTPAAVTGTTLTATTSATLQHSASTKLATTSTGVDVTGTVTADGLTVDGTTVLDSETNFVADTYASNKSLVLASQGATGGNGALGASVAFSRINTESPRAAIAAINTDSNFERMGLSFWTHEDNFANVMKKRMVIDHEGDISFYENTGTTPKFFWDASAEALGIGDAAILAPLSLETNSSGWAISLEENAGAETWQIGVDVDGDLNFYNSQLPTPQFTINDSGNVGIGTGSPSEKLVVEGATPFILVNNTDESRSGIRFADAQNIGERFQLAFDAGTAAMCFDRIESTGVVTERLRIDSSGRVGIGTSSPSGAKLHVADTAAIVKIDGTTVDAKLSLTVAGSEIGFLYANPSQVITGSTAAVPYIIRTSNTERLRIDASGNVGIGTTSPYTSTSYNSLTVGGSLRGLVALKNASAADVGYLFAASDNATTIETSGLADIALRATGAYNIRLHTNNAERLRIDSSGNVGIGTSSPSAKLDVSGGIIANNVSVENASSVSGSGMWGTTTTLAFNTGSTERMRITSAGNVGIGTTSPSGKLHVVGGRSYLQTSSGDQYVLKLTNPANADGVWLGTPAADSFAVYTAAGSERMRIDASGNVGIGTTSPVFPLDVRATTDPSIGVYSTGTAATDDAFVRIGIGGNTAQSRIAFGDVDNSVVGGILYAHSSDYMAFYTNAAEVMRLDASGNVTVGTAQTPATLVGASVATGVGFDPEGYGVFTRSGAQPLYLNRLTDDGQLISLRQAGVAEGSISVSGTTVSYNGGHLSRWSRLPDGADDSNILKGTVMTNLNEKVVWDGEDNEQLNYTTASSVEGDKNVAGVFVAWDDSDEWGDYYLAMTGDMIIRIAAGTTVERGDLLMSAGDGTAKPQEDDIVRSKTIAKVISTEVTCTYEDGSYCVPCVLMAC